MQLKYSKYRAERTFRLGIEHYKASDITDVCLGRRTLEIWHEKGDVMKVGVPIFGMLFAAVAVLFY